MEEVFKAALVIFPVSWTIAKLHGPFGWCKLFRDRIQSRCYTEKDEWLYSGVQCPLCVSFWVATAFIFWCGPMGAYAAWGLSCVATLFFAGWVPPDPEVSYEEVPVPCDDLENPTEAGEDVDHG